MKKYLVHLCLITISLAGCSNHHTDPQPQQQQTQTQPSNPNTVSGKYVLYLKIDTVYDYYSATQFYYNITHETLTGDTLYLKAGTANQVVQPNPIAGYNPKITLADTLDLANGTNSGNAISVGFQYNSTSKTFVVINLPGNSANFYIIDKNTVEIVSRYKDLDNPDNFWTDTHGWYFKKM